MNLTCMDTILDIDSFWLCRIAERFLYAKNCSSSMPKIYFSQRSGKLLNNISLSEFKQKFIIIFQDFVKDRYFERMGVYYDSDSASINGINVIGDKLTVAFGSKGKNMIPTPQNITKLNRNSLFDLIELLSDYASKRYTSTQYRPQNSQGFDNLVSEPYESNMESIRVTTDNHEAGQIKWRDTLNEHLKQLCPPYRLTKEYTVEILPESEGHQHLIDNCTSHSKDAQTRIKHAQRLFLRHGTTKEDKRSALKDLADVLESIRDKFPSSLSKDECDLFNIANNYAIRHYKSGQKDNYDEIYMEWIFYSFISAINLITKLDEHHNAK